MKILIINGPNLNKLGEREPEVYGTFSLENLETELNQLSQELGAQTAFFQSNHEGEIIDALQGATAKYDGIIINPAGFSHTSVAIHDALKLISIPKIEVHLSHVFGREDFRANLVTARSCDGLISGFGIDSYRLAIKFLLEKGN